MKGKVTENVLHYMNAISQKQFTYVIVSNIAKSIKDEYYNRKACGLIINGKMESGKKQINNRIADIVNRKLGVNTITSDDVRLYKRCFAEEYTNRTGKCAWGFKEVRQRLGFDVNTGLEIINV